jgi:hypothetical protein
VQVVVSLRRVVDHLAAETVLEYVIDVQVAGAGGGTPDLKGAEFYNFATNSASLGEGQDALVGGRWDGRWVVG